MQIETKLEAGRMLVKVSGSLNTVTSPELQAVVDALDAATVKELYLDFAEVDYVSSAGLRVLLMANKKLHAAGSELKIASLRPSVMEVFEMTGFSDILNLV